jgi:hypothetical protein
MTTKRRAGAQEVGTQRLLRRSRTKHSKRSTLVSIAVSTAENGRFSSIDVWLCRFTSQILNDGRSLLCAEIGIRAASPGVNL